MWAVVAMCMVGAVPIVWPIMSQNEGKWWPVVTDIKVEALNTIELRDKRIALNISMDFNKVRQCDFVALHWYDSFGTRVPVVFAQDNGGDSVTRPVGDDQSAGPVTLIGIADLEGTYAVLESRCHPLWKTFTPFYP